MNKSLYNHDLIKKITSEYGTPAHILDFDRLKTNFEGLSQKLSHCTNSFQILYSFKTNYLPTICKEMLTLGAGADVVSGYELNLAIECGFPPDKIVFNGPVKRRNELLACVNYGAKVNIDGEHEIEILQEIASKKGVVVAVGLRVNPGVNVYFSEDSSYNEVSKNSMVHSKFGWLIDGGDAKRMATSIHRQKNLKLTSIHCHLGSQITHTPSYISALDKVLSFVSDLKQQFPITDFNIGGGFGVEGIHRLKQGPVFKHRHYHGDDHLEERRDTFDWSLMMDALNSSLKKLELNDLNLYCEPGRFLVSDTMALITEVVGVKNTSVGKWLILDGGLNLLPTAGVTEERNFHAIGEHGKKTSMYMVGGPLCYEGDVFSMQTELPSDLKSGNLVMISDSGAYSVSRSTNFMYPRVPVIAYKGEDYHLCWRREEFSDVFRFNVPIVYNDHKEQVVS